MEDESDEEVSFNLQRYTAPITMEVPPRSSPSSLSGLDLNEDEGERNQRDRRDSAKEASELTLLSESDGDEEGVIPKPPRKDGVGWYSFVASAGTVSASGSGNAIGVSGGPESSSRDGGYDELALRALGSAGSESASC